jgi:uncharacterized protein (DUF433 family)
VTTKSLSQNRPIRSHVELAAYTGKPDVADEHPLITCAPHIMEGHAHLKSTKVTVERVLRAVLNERPDSPLVLGTGLKLTDAEVSAAFAYAIDIFNNLSKIYAELGRLREFHTKTGKGPSHHDT